MRNGCENMRGRRNQNIESELQSILDNGRNVWVIGDVHGHADTLSALLKNLQLGVEDRVVLLGDMVDRGPKSSEVIRIAREDPRVFAVLGNHEELMLQNFDIESLTNLSLNNSRWYYVGGRETNQSYVEEFTDLNGELDDFGLRMRVGRDLAWLDSLPHHIVLNKFRLVHAGYSPSAENPDLQTPNTLMWIRGEFHNSSYPIDDKRTVIFGHSTMPYFGLSQNQIWKSKCTLTSGFAAAIGIDSCCYGGDDPQLTAFNLQTHEIVKQRIVNTHYKQKVIREKIETREMRI